MLGALKNFRSEAIRIGNLITANAERAIISSLEKEAISKLQYLEDKISPTGRS